MTFKPNSLRTVMLMAVAPVIGLAFQSCGDDNMKEVEVKTSGTYLMEFDYSLLRSRITLVK